jgi:hypothetical protein
MKECYFCKIIKSLDEFKVRGDNGKLNNICKPCVAIKQKEYYNNNKKYLLKENKKYRLENKKEITRAKKKHYKENIDDILLQKQLYYKSNRSEILKKTKKHHKENKNKISKYQKFYRLNNKEKIRENRNIWEANKYNHDMTYRLSKIVSRSISGALKKSNSGKYNKSCWNYLKYSKFELITYLQSLFEDWMNWENYGKYDPKTWNENNPTTWKWNIDHIVPQSDLPYSSMEDENFQKCWRLENLRPLSAKQNLLDGLTRVRHAIY